MLNAVKYSWNSTNTYETARYNYSKHVRHGFSFILRLNTTQE